METPPRPNEPQKTKHAWILWVSLALLAILIVSNLFPSGSTLPWSELKGKIRAGQVERVEVICVIREAIEALIRMLAPFAPHTAEELWELLGYDKTLAHAGWPTFDAAVAKAEEITIPVQINGKVRTRLTVPADTTQQELERLALSDPAVVSHLGGRPVRKVVVVQGRLVSIVID